MLAPTRCVDAHVFAVVPARTLMSMRELAGCDHVLQVGIVPPALELALNKLGRGIDEGFITKKSKNKYQTPDVDGL